MGLDMYLDKEYYVKNWNHMQPEELHTVTILKGGKPTNIPTDKIKYVVVEAMYWRKANAIHKWFVDNVQEGNDDCGRYYVDKEKLKELLSICTKVLDSTKLVPGAVINGYHIDKNGQTPNIEMGKTMEKISVAEELLPTASGFFFGGTDYNEWYFDDIKRTKETLDKLLNNDDGGDYYYHSSW